jgi:hypothetical protein
MTDVQRCLQDGYSTAGTPGNGLGAVRRLSSVFDIFSVADSGSVILAQLRRSPPSPTAPTFEIGAVSLPAPHETVCGDAWRLVERPGECAVLVADGLGHGPQAAEAARRACAAFAEAPFDEVTTFIERAHRALAGSRGAALAVARLGPGGLRYAGVGNIAGTLVGGERPRGLASQNGTVGLQIRKPQAFDFALPPRGVLVMHSDGLSGRWTLETYPGLALRHPAVIAGVLWRDYGRGRDDATIVVVARALPAHG